MKNIIIACLAIALSIVTYQLVTTPQQEGIPVIESEEIELLPETESLESRVPDQEICIGEYCDGSMRGEEDSFTVVQIPLVVSEGTIGCGEGIVFSPHTVAPKTKAVLDASYQTLFALKHMPEIPSDGVRNIVALEENLFYNGVSIDNMGTSRLLLEGTATTIYNCTIPTFRAQIEQTALQFDTVNTLEVYLNDKLWNWCDFSQADPEEDGCDTQPKYWIATQ